MYRIKFKESDKFSNCEFLNKNRNLKKISTRTKTLIIRSHILGQILWDEAEVRRHEWKDAVPEQGEQDRLQGDRRGAGDCEGPSPEQGQAGRRVPGPGRRRKNQNQLINDFFLNIGKFHVFLLL